MDLKYRINKYNWYGQKLLSLHQYDDIIKLRQYHSTQITILENQLKVNHHTNEDSQYNLSFLQMSEHLIYVYGLALMKTSTRLGEVIYAVQRLNFDKNSDYFLLLCQCLLYIGNYDSVVALCRQIINKEIDSHQSHKCCNSTRDQFEDDRNLDQIRKNYQESFDFNVKNDYEKILEDPKCREFVFLESNEFQKIFSNINKNQLINQPKLWFIFGLALEYQHQFKDAFMAQKISSKLSLGNPGYFFLNSNRSVHHHSDNNLSGQQKAILSQKLNSSQIDITISNYYNPNLKYADFCLKKTNDIKSAIQVLSQASFYFPQNYSIISKLALLISLIEHNQNSSPSSSLDTNYSANRAVRVISKLESYSASNRNPALLYNNIALKCKQKFNQYNYCCDNLYNDTYHLLLTGNSLEIGGDENRINLNYILTKVHIILNNIIQESNNKVPISMIFSNNDNKSTYNENKIEWLNQTQKLIDNMRNCDSTCWASASLWNNLGICYLTKKKYIASLSCLIKAHSINPLDWRVNYNLALAFLHKGLISRAFLCLSAAKKFYFKTGNLLKFHDKGYNHHPLITTLLAICFETLNQFDEARRLYVETIRPKKKLSLSGVPIVSLINYLIFLHVNSHRYDYTHSNDVKAGDHDDKSNNHERIKLLLLDLLEQTWLQRDQNDPQYNYHLLEVASRIGEETFELSATSSSKRKIYAWSKRNINSDQ